MLLVTGAALLFLSWNDILGGLRDIVLAAVVVVVAVGLILAPFLWRLAYADPLVRSVQRNDSLRRGVITLSDLLEHVAIT